MSHPTDLPIAERRLRDDPAGVPFPHPSEALQLICARSTDEQLRQRAAATLRQRGEQVPERDTRLRSTGVRLPTPSADATIARDRESRRERELAHARAVLAREGEAT